jgi:hypothetical protein
MNRFFSETVWIDFLRITLVILVLIILYRRLLGYLSRKHVKQEDFCTLFDVEDQPVTGQIPFYFTTKKPREISLTIETLQGELLHTVVEENFEPGGHLCRFDSLKMETGIYFYVLKTENQESRKKIQIQH